MKESIENMLSNLIDATKSGDIIWEDISDSNKFKYERKLESNSEDNLTKFSVEIKYKLFDNNWKMEAPSLFVYNKNLPGGVHYVYGDKYNGNKELIELLKELYCKDLNPNINDVSDIFDDISKNISISAIREIKINKIFK
jgi:hypothetical protein